MALLKWRATTPHYNGDRWWLPPRAYNASVRGFGTYGFGNSRWPWLARVKALWNLVFGARAWWN
jgi:hypothetical protein